MADDTGAGKSAGASKGPDDSNGGSNDGEGRGTQGAPRAGDKRRAGDETPSGSMPPPPKKKITPTKDGQQAKGVQSSSTPNLAKGTGPNKSSPAEVVKSSGTEPEISPPKGGKTTGHTGANFDRALAGQVAQGGWDLQTGEPSQEDSNGGRNDTDWIDLFASDESGGNGFIEETLMTETCEQVEIQEAIYMAQPGERGGSFQPAGTPETLPGIPPKTRITKEVVSAPEITTQTVQTLPPNNPRPANQPTRQPPPPKAERPDKATRKAEKAATRERRKAEREQKLIEKRREWAAGGGAQDAAIMISDDTESSEYQSTDSGGDDDPAGIAVQQPVQKPVQQPVQKPEQKPVQKPEQKPAPEPAEKPAEEGEAGNVDKDGDGDGDGGDIPPVEDEEDFNSLFDGDGDDIGWTDNTFEDIGVQDPDTTGGDDTAGIGDVPENIEYIGGGVPPDENVPGGGTDNGPPPAAQAKKDSKAKINSEILLEPRIASPLSNLNDTESVANNDEVTPDVSELWALTASHRQELIRGAKNLFHSRPGDAFWVKKWEREQGDPRQDDAYTSKLEALQLYRIGGFVFNKNGKRVKTTYLASHAEDDRRVPVEYQLYPDIQSCWVTAHRASNILDPGGSIDLIHQRYVSSAGLQEGWFIRSLEQVMVNQQWYWPLKGKLEAPLVGLKKDQYAVLIGPLKPFNVVEFERQKIQKDENGETTAATGDLNQRSSSRLGSERAKVQGEANNEAASAAKEAPKEKREMEKQTYFIWCGPSGLNFQSLPGVEGGWQKTERDGYLARVISRTKHLNNDNALRGFEEALIVHHGQDLTDESITLAIASVTEAITRRGKFTFALMSDANRQLAMQEGHVYGDVLVKNPRRPLMLNYTVTSNPGAAQRTTNSGGHHFLFYLEWNDYKNHMEATLLDSCLGCGAYGKPEQRRQIAAAIYKCAANSGWTDGEYKMDLVVPQNYSPQQGGSWQCGIHTILNAWCLALTLRINYRRTHGLQDPFYHSAVEMIRYALAGSIDFWTIYYWLVGSGYAWAKTPSELEFLRMERYFKQTTKFKSDLILGRYVAGRISDIDEALSDQTTQEHDRALQLTTEEMSMELAISGYPPQPTDAREQILQDYVDLQNSRRKTQNGVQHRSLAPSHETVVRDLTDAGFPPEQDEPILNIFSHWQQTDAGKTWIQVLDDIKEGTLPSLDVMEEDLKNVCLPPSDPKSVSEMAEKWKTSTKGQDWFAALQGEGSNPTNTATQSIGATSVQPKQAHDGIPAMLDFINWTRNEFRPLGPPLPMDITAGAHAIERQCKITETAFRQYLSRRGFRNLDETVDADHGQLRAWYEQVDSRVRFIHWGQALPEHFESGQNVNGNTDDGDIERIRRHFRERLVDFINQRLAGQGADLMPFETCTDNELKAWYHAVTGG